MVALTYDKIKDLVKKHNKSKKASNELVIALIWKESGFDQESTAAGSTATGLMQVTKGAVKDVNDNTDDEFDHGAMKDGATNIECGTQYLDLRIKRAGGDVKKGLEGYGTGVGYADNLLECEKCLKKDETKHEACLAEIHA